MRVLIAGVGNVLRGDDGFGVEVLHRLEHEIGGEAGVTFYESGIAGIGLVQQLLDGYDALIILDAFDRGAVPGTIFVQEPDVQALAGPGRPCEPVDLHQADPEAVLRLAAALGALPHQVWVVGCQAAACDEWGAGLSEPARRAIPTALRQVHSLLKTMRAAARETNGSV
jgi:hydrogenase maturation protease